MEKFVKMAEGLKILYPEISGTHLELLINRVSNHIKRYQGDFYQLSLSRNSVNDCGWQYYDWYKVDCFDVECYITYLVD